MSGRTSRCGLGGIMLYIGTRLRRGSAVSTEASPMTRPYRTILLTVLGLALLLLAVSLTPQ